MLELSWSVILLELAISSISTKNIWTIVISKKEGKGIYKVWLGKLTEITEIDLRKSVGFDDNHNHKQSTLRDKGVLNKVESFFIKL